MDPAQPELVVDDRELKSPTARKLFALGVKLHSQRLEVGDFIVGETVGLERKTAADFEQSIVDGRLFSQARDLSSSFPAPLVAIVGSDFSRLAPRALLGAEIALATDFRIPVFHFASEDALAGFLHALALQKSKPAKDAVLRFEKKAFTLAQRQQFIIESLPQVGPRNAKALLKHFKSVERVFTAPEEQLREAEGIGRERAREIRRVSVALYDS